MSETPRPHDPPGPGEDAGADRDQESGPGPGRDSGSDSDSDSDHDSSHAGTPPPEPVGRSVTGHPQGGGPGTPEKPAYSGKAATSAAGGLVERISGAARSAKAPRGGVPALFPGWARQGPLREGAFQARLHDARTAVSLGRVLGAVLVICFVTGLFSHYLQDPPTWAANDLPSRPSWGYRLTQGTHVASGIAAIPLVLAKLWTVYPRLFAWPPLRSLLHGLERLSILVLVAATLLQLLTGLLNTLQWYPWPWNFRPTHWALAWVVIGALALHIAVKAPEIAAHWWRRSPGTLRLPATDVPDRRAFLATVGAAVGAVTVTTVGQSFTPLKDLDLLAPRHPDYGIQHLPVNRTASAAGVTAARVADWRLTVRGPRPYDLTLPQLRAMQQRSVVLPVACVEGWSKNAHWAGIRIRDLLDQAGAPHDARIRVVSLQLRGAYAVMEMGHLYARDPLTLLALSLNGDTLSPDHGFPARIIAPNRPGVLQTKWVTRLEVLA